ncbi:MAG: MFS transporter [Desulfobacteraceae bacterium]
MYGKVSNEGDRPNMKGGKAFQKNRQVSLKIKVLYGAGQIANSMKTMLFGIFSLFFYTSVMGLPGSWVGIACGIGLLWDALIDPIIGTLSDNMPGRLGKRHGFMIVGSTVMGISFYAYFAPPQSLEPQILFWWLLFMNLAVRTSSSIFSIPYYALGAELSSDYHERTTLSGVRSAFALAGTLLAAVSSFLIFFPETSGAEDSKLHAEGYRYMGVAFGIAMTSVSLISTFGTLSFRNYTQKKDSMGVACSFGRIVQLSWLTLKNTSFCILFFSYAVFFFGTVINATLSIHFLTYYADISSSKALSIFHLFFYIGALAGVVFWVRSSKTVEKRLLYFIGTIATSLLMACAYFLLGKGHLLGAGDIRPLLVGHGAAGFFASVLWIIPASMIADVSDEDELFNGKRREGLFFGMFQFGEQIAAGAAIAIAGFLIDWYAGLVPGALQQADQTIDRIGLAYSLIPSGCLVLSSALILGYSLNHKKVDTIQFQLANRTKLSLGE